MKHIKFFENNEEGCYIVVEIITACAPTLTIFKNRESAENFVVNAIHEYTTGLPIYKQIENIFGAGQLMRIWNEHNDGSEIYIVYETYSENVEIDEELKLRMNINKYNL